MNAHRLRTQPDRVATHAQFVGELIVLVEDEQVLVEPTDLLVDALLGQEAQRDGGANRPGCIVGLAAVAIPVAQHQRAEEVQFAAVVMHDVVVVTTHRTRLHHRDRVVLVHARAKLRQAAWFKHDVVVEEQHPLAVGGFRPDVAGVARSAIEAGIDQPHLGIALRDDRTRLVIRVVVDHDNLRWRRILGQKGVDALGQIVLPVPIDDDCADHERGWHGSDGNYRCPQCK